MGAENFYYEVIETVHNYNEREIYWIKHYNSILPNGYNYCLGGGGAETGVGSANAKIRNNEVYLLNTHISEYKEGNIFNHDPRRTRKLLLHKREILKLRDKVEQEGLTLVPLKLYMQKNKVKILLGLCKGKKNFDKRETMKERDLKREASKLQKYNYKA